MSKQDMADHHQPRRVDKKKHHRPGFSEEIQDNRKTRISFKNYVRSLEEDDVDSEYQEWVAEQFDGDDWFELGRAASEVDAQIIIDDVCGDDETVQTRVRQADD